MSLGIEPRALTKTNQAFELGPGSGPALISSSTVDPAPFRAKQNAGDFFFQQFYIFSPPPLVRSLVGLDLDGGLLRHVEAVQELPDVLVLDGGGLLDEGGALADGLQVVARHDELVLLLLGVLALDALVHAHAPDELLAEEVAHLDQGAGLGDGAVDGEMGVDGAHLVLVALGGKGGREEVEYRHNNSARQLTNFSFLETIPTDTAPVFPRHLNNF